jgi:hypothetical protein
LINIDNTTKKSEVLIGRVQKVEEEVVEGS